jgi:DNA polymerase elongation subunit (family B)
MEKVAIHQTTCRYEYNSQQRYIVPLPEKETLVPYKICSFDIEADSSHGDFPIPIKTYKRLANQMVDVLDSKNSTEFNLVFKDALLTAFGYDETMKNTIDLVYPKEIPSREELMQSIEDILNIRNRIVKTEKRSLSVEYHFAKIQTQTLTFGDADEDAEVDDDDDDDTDDKEEEVDEEEEVEAKATVKGVVKATAKGVNISGNLPEYWKTLKTKDEKVERLNYILTQYLPELEGDRVTFIGSTFIHYGEIEPYLNHCLVVGTCDTIEGVVVESHSTENEVLLAWTELIQRENPDIIIGYNIFGFDYEFMFRRAMENDCHESFLQLSRILGHIGAKVDRHTGEYSLENTKVKLASGEYNLLYPSITGRLQIDLYQYFRREFNLPCYKLDYISGTYINDTIVRLYHESDTTCLVTKNTTGLQKNDYIHIEISEFTTDYLQNGKKYKVLDILAADTTTTTIVVQRWTEAAIAEWEENQGKMMKWGLAKDDVSPQDIFRLTRGTSADRAIVAKYCVQDCNIVHHLMRKIDLLVGYIEMSRICSVPMTYLVLRGQGIKLTSFVAKKCREKDTLMPDLQKSGDNDGYEGAIVLPPKCGIYLKNPVACLDYSSLYPSNMISQNFSHDTKVWVREYDLQDKLIHQTTSKYDDLPGIEYVDVEFDTYRYTRTAQCKKAKKVKSGRRVVRWAQTTPMGILPSILTELLQARKATKKQAEKETDEFMKNILDKRQLAYKVTANSLYGQCGSKTSTFYDKDIAASTTAIGRKMIIYAKRMIEEVYGNLICSTSKFGNVQTNAEYIYGDTDSVFFTFNLSNPQTHAKIEGKLALEITIELAQEAARLCTKFLKAPMELSYEKTQMPFILLSKKRYVSTLYELNPNKGKLKFMGLTLKRRDACDYLKDVYGGILNRLMDTNETDKNRIIKSCLQFISHSLQELIEGHVPMDKLCLTRALRSDYKNTPGHKILADRISERDPGNKPKSGDRLQFAYIYNANPRALEGHRIETPEFILANRLNLDYNYYITNKLMKPLQQLLGLAVEDIWDAQDKHGALRRFRQDMQKLAVECKGDIELYAKKREKVTSHIIKDLIFNEYLIKIQNKNSKVRAITHFFVGK